MYIPKPVSAPYHTDLAKSCLGLDDNWECFPMNSALGPILCPVRWFGVLFIFSSTPDQLDLKQIE